jgi:hypothetical protein
MPATPFSSWFERTVVLMLLVMLVFVVWIGSSLSVYVDKVQTDIKALRGFLSSLSTPMQCPPPGEHTTMICHYRLQIKEPHGDHKGWFVATIPQEVVKKANADCETMKANPKKPDMKNHLCIDPATYTYRQYAIQIDGTVPDKEPHDFVYDPVTNRLVFLK